MNHQRPVTIKQVAARAGVSTQTVSRVINNRPDVAPETFEHVQQVIKQMGYVPNAFARGLSAGRSCTIGVVAYGLHYYGPSRMLTGVEQEAAKHGYSTLLSLVHEPESDDVDHILQSLLARQVDGILWAIPEIGRNRAALHQHAASAPTPIVFIGGKRVDMPAPVIHVDNFAIGHLATEHLIMSGAKRIGIITGPLSWWEAEARLAGWRNALAMHGLAGGNDRMAEGDWSAASGEGAMKQLLERHPDLDAVFASNDQMALGALHALHESGQRVPEEVAIVGADNIPESEHFWPPLTTVRQGLQDAGSIAVRELVRVIDRPPHTQPPPIQSVTLQPELVMRASSTHV